MRVAIAGHADRGAFEAEKIDAPIEYLEIQNSTRRADRNTEPWRPVFVGRLSSLRTGRSRRTARAPRAVADLSETIAAPPTSLGYGAGKRRRIAAIALECRSGAPGVALFDATPCLTTRVWSTARRPPDGPALLYLRLTGLTNREWNDS